MSRAITRMRVGNGHFPQADVREHGPDKLSEGERHDQFEIVRPADVDEPSDAAQVEERARIDGYGQQLYHRHRHRIRELIQQRLAHDVTAGTDHVPHAAQQRHGDHFLGHHRHHDDETDVCRSDGSRRRLPLTTRPC